MVDLCHCRLCGQSTDRPIIFPYTIQRVFNYIFDNPGCTTKEIEEEFYGRTLIYSNIVSVTVSKIRTGLVGTGFVLDTKNHPRPQEFGARRVSTYRIIRPKTRPLKEIVHGIT